MKKIVPSRPRAAAPVCAIFTCVAGWLSAATAADPPEAVPMLNLNLGQAGIFDTSGDLPLRFGIEFRGRSFSRWNLIPGVGATFADNGASFIYADLRRYFWLDDRWVVIPSFGVGMADDGKGLDLGSTIEFRSGLEMAYRFRGEHRIGVALFHVSNGGISEQNPGTEVLVASLSMPLHRRERVSGR